MTTSRCRRHHALLATGCSTPSESSSPQYQLCNYMLCPAAMLFHVLTSGQDTQPVNCLDLVWLCLVHSSGMVSGTVVRGSRETCYKTHNHTCISDVQRISLRPVEWQHVPSTPVCQWAHPSPSPSQSLTMECPPCQPQSHGRCSSQHPALLGSTTVTAAACRSHVQPLQHWQLQLSHLSLRLRQLSARCLAAALEVLPPSLMGLCQGSP